MDIRLAIFDSYIASLNDNSIIRIFIDIPYNYT